MEENNHTDKYNFTVNGKPYLVQPEGSLGLLALGYKGLQAWREVKKEFEMQNKSEIEKQQPKSEG